MMQAAPKELVAKVLKKDDFNDYYIKCVGNHVTIKLNGEITVDGDFPKMPKDGVIAWQLHAGGPMEVTFRKIQFKNLSQTIAQPEAKKDQPPWKRLVVGNDTTPWKTAGKKEKGGISLGNWDIKDGVLTGKGTAAKTRVYLVHNHKIRDFELKLEAKLEGGKGKALIHFRSSLPKAGFSGPAVDFGSGTWGGLYEAETPLSPKVTPSSPKLLKAAPDGIVVEEKDFNDIQVRCVGKRCTITMKGVVTVDDEFPSIPEAGVFGFAIDSGTDVTFREVFYRELQVEK
jgi:hypothetical protein